MDVRPSSFILVVDRHPWREQKNSAVSIILKNPHIGI